MSKIDSVDRQIVLQMGENARQSSEQLAKKLNLSPATVRRRLKKLIKNDVMRVVGLVEPAKFGFPLLSVIALDVVADKLEITMESLVARPEVKFAATTTGRFDIIATAWFTSSDHLSEFIVKYLGKLEGVRDSEALLCMGVKKGDYVPPF